ncbi:uncharacterized protein UHO2_06572 [Ustilago hordei]|uniref:PH domain-containing protein n=1 Tax=Ustilago hordei TaxID=120017 RepID=I2FV00_USTHO|nr:uncharacterized protein UHO2_06572 [Ustilago hordei]CCF50743.1 uncharacterized protein UHOR_06306 [Ustilago hordei]SYW77275.1 uncharacterized protein UHO2_06572 [Ustilago hordei]
MISSLLLRITSSWPVCASFSALRLLLFLIGGSNETGDPQEERLCWILTLRSAIQVRQDTEVEPDEMLSMRRQASEQSRTKRGASAGFVEIGRGDAELDEAMEGEEKDMDAQIRVPPVSEVGGLRDATGRQDKHRTERARPRSS